MTGATGLIGRWIQRLWAPADRRGHLLGVGHRDTDLLQPGAFVDLIERVQPDIVVHLAWSAGGTGNYRLSPDNRRWADVSLEAALSCSDVGIAFLAFGTVLDDQPPTDDYSRSKYELHKALEPTIATGQITWMRPYYVFDALEDRPTVLALAREAQARGRTPTLNRPHARHDFIHAADVARAVITIVDNRQTGVIEVGSGRQHTVAELVTGAGYAWTEGDQPVEEAHDSRTADTSILRAAGWAPAETDRYFADG